MKKIGVLVVVFLIALIVSVSFGFSNFIGISLVLMISSLALLFMQHPILKNFSFTIWVMVFVSASLFYPSAFGRWFGFDLAILIVPLIQIIMFGMGTTLSLADFKRVITMPWPVLIGMFLQFTVMPVAGFTIATLFGFEPAVAAGIILVGSCPGGVASNLMAYLANGNVALSVTMTSCSTLVSPLMTPFLMKTLAGRLVPINFIEMMLSILNMIIVPIIAGLIANKILYSKTKKYQKVKPLGAFAVLGIGLAIISLLIPESIYGALRAVKSGLVLGLALLGIVSLAKLVIGIWLRGPKNWMDKALPLVSKAGICFIIGIITARSSDKLLSVGLALIAAAIIHNFIGYTLGYWLARFARMDKRKSRTIAFEVGMQNGGMASGLAMTVLNSANAALGPAIFGPWMNISGSVLANYWNKKSKSE